MILEILDSRVIPNAILNQKLIVGENVDTFKKQIICSLYIMHKYLYTCAYITDREELNLMNVVRIYICIYLIFFQVSYSC